MVSTIHQHGASRGMEWNGMGRKEKVNRSHCTTEYSIQETCFVCVCVCVCYMLDCVCVCLCYMLDYDVKCTVFSIPHWELQYKVFESDYSIGLHMNTGSSFKGNEISKKNIYIKRGEEEGKQRKQRKEGILLSRGAKTDMIKGTLSWFIDFWNPVFTLK